MLLAELQAMGQFAKRNKVELVVISAAALFLTLDSYHKVWNSWASSLLYYALLPILVIVIVLRKNPLDYGLRLGNPRVWGFHVLVACIVGAPILFAVSQTPPYQSYYGMKDFALVRYFLITLATLFGSEFLFRGFMLFGLKDKLKEWSIPVQMVPFVLVHFGKPEVETLSTVLTGLYFGYVCYRGNSFWPAFIFHMFINVFFVASVNLF